MTTAYRLDHSERATYRRYARLALPRHTSYPTVAVWRPDYGPQELKSDLRRSADHGGPLSMYVHIPYCERLCYCLVSVDHGPARFGDERSSESARAGTSPARANADMIEGHIA
jgi:oxygen-independent coproporphyrinogen-3 oxidase